MGCKTVIINNWFFRFIGEETVAKEDCLPQLTNDPTWIIDPIDGTTNFVHRFPHTCISVALLVNKKVEIGMIYNPLMRQFFSARKHCGAFLNGKPIKTSDVKGKLHLFFNTRNSMIDVTTANNKKTFETILIYYYVLVV